MMNMINANFTKQDSQNPQVGEASEKDAKTDDFTSLLNGLCMTPQTDPKAAAEKPAEVDFRGELCGEFRMAGDRANLGSVKFNDPKNPSFDQLPQPVELDLKTARSLRIPAGELPQNIQQQHLRWLTDRTGAGFLPGEGSTKMAPQITVPLKPLVKDLKTQADKFIEVPPETAETPVASTQIKVAKNFAAMTKEKSAVMQSLANTAIQIHFDPATIGADTDARDPVDQAAAHDFNYVMDPVRLAELVKDKGQRKLPKLISDVTEIAGEENASILQGEAVAKADAPAAATGAKMPPMLEQIKPAFVLLAAAVANEGKQILKMRLHPAELGTVEIRLEKTEAGVLEAHFKTDNDTAKHFLTHGLDSLRDALQNAGWQVGRMEISSSPFSSSDSPPQKNAGHHNETSSSSNIKNFEPDHTRSDDTASTSADRLVNLRA